MLRSALLAGLTGLCTVAAGTTYYSSQSAHTALDELLRAPELAAGPIRLVEQSRESGLLATRGRLGVSLDLGCFEADGQLQALPLAIDYTIEHSPDLKGLSRFALAMSLTDEADEKLLEILGRQAVFTMNGQVGFNGRMNANFATPAIDADAPDGRGALRVAASMGEVHDQDGATAVAWQLPSIEMTTPKGRVDIGRITLAGHYTDPVNGFGSQTLGISAVSVQDKRGRTQFRMEDVRLEQSQRLEGDTISASTEPSIGHLAVAGESLHDLGMRVALEGVDAGAFLRLQDLSRVGCHQALDEKHLQQVERTLLDLIDKGMRLDIENIRGRRGEQPFSGRMLFALAPADAATPSLVERTRFEIQASVDERLVPPPFVEAVLAQGLIENRDGALKTALTVADGRLRVNGTPAPESMDQQIGGALAMGEMSLTGWRQQIQSGESPLASAASRLLLARAP